MDEKLTKDVAVSIVSIQADQSRPLWAVLTNNPIKNCFNRINSGRSIPTRFA